MRQTWENQVAISAPCFFFLWVLNTYQVVSHWVFMGCTCFFWEVSTINQRDILRWCRRGLGCHGQSAGNQVQPTWLGWSFDERRPIICSCLHSSSRGLNGRIVSNSYIVVTENKFRSQPGCLQVFGTAFSWTSSLTLPIAQRRRCQITGAQWAPLWTTVCTAFSDLGIFGSKLGMDQNWSTTFLDGSYMVIL